MVSERSVCPLVSCLSVWLAVCPLCGECCLVTVWSSYGLNSTASVSLSSVSHVFFLSVILSSFLPSFISAYFPACFIVYPIVFTHLLTILPLFPHSCTPRNLPTYMLYAFLSFVPSLLASFSRSFPPTYVLIYLPTYLPSCLPAYLTSFLSTDFLLFCLIT